MLNPKFQGVIEQAGLSLTRSLSPKTDFLVTWLNDCLSCVGKKGSVSHFPVSAYFTTASAAPDQISWSGLYHLKIGFAQRYTVWPIFPLLALCSWDTFFVTQLNHFITFIYRTINICTVKYVCHHIKFSDITVCEYDPPSPPPICSVTLLYLLIRRQTGLLKCICNV